MSVINCSQVCKSKSKLISKTILLSIISLILCLTMYAQDSLELKYKIDSLKSIVRQASHDTVKVKAWVEWEKLIYMHDPDQDIKLIKLIDSVCVANLEKELPKKEHEFFLSRKKSALIDLGVYYFTQQNNEQAMESFQSALVIARDKKDQRSIGVCLNNLAAIYESTGNFQRAVEMYTDALRLGEEIGNDHITGNALNNIGIIYSNLEQNDQAKSYYDRSLLLARKIGNKELEANVLNNIGILHTELKNDSLAMSFFQQSLNIREEINDSDGIYVSLINIGSIYLRENNIGKALELYERGLMISTNNNYKSGIASCLSEIGECYLATEDFRTALRYLNKSLKISVEIDDKQELWQVLKRLYKAHRELGNAKTALSYYERYVELDENLKSSENQSMLIRKEFEYKYDKQKALDKAIQDKKDAVATEEKEKQRIITYSIGGGLLLVFGLLLVIFNKFQVTKRQKQIIEQQTQKLKELDEAKSRFFTNISHEFRTPLTIISGMVDQVKSKPEIWLEKGTEMIKQNTIVLLKLVNQILDLRKLESKSLNLNLTQGNIVPYLKYISESFQPLAQSKGLQIHFLAESESLNMDYDADKILRIISNLLSNAIKFTPDGGHVYFQINKIHSQEDGKEILLIQIKDTGIGIPEDQLPQIFDQFYQIDDSSTRKGEGTGIGLTLIQELVNLMNGKIEATSELGKGTTFLISLPITNQSVVTESFAPTQFAKPEIPVEKIIEESAPAFIKNIEDPSLPILLIVEDNHDVAQFIISCLEGEYQLHVAQNGQEGIDKAIEEVPDLIVSDVMMPEKDGFELCETLKQDERTSHIPIVLLTAKADLDSKISGLKRGADAYLSKPFEPEELLVRLENLLEVRKNLQKRYASNITTETSDALKLEDEFIQKIRKIVHENMENEDFGTLALCQKLRMSRTQVHNKIKTLTNKSTSLFIRSIRLQEAKGLLQTTDLNISEVGYKVGFSNPAYFSRIFAEEFGAPPSRTRK